MAIKILLILCIGLVGLWFIRNNGTSKIKASKKIGILLLIIFAFISVVFPSLTDDIAHALGVGRGADLLLYAVTVTFFAFVMNQYIKGKQDEQRIVKLARRVALLETELKNKDKKNSRG